MNKVILTGRLTKDNELRYTQNQTPYCVNSIAVRKNTKNANGDYETNFINLVFWGQTANYISQYSNKGDLIGVTGRWETRTYQNTYGQNAIANECVVEQAEVILRANKEKTFNDIKPEYEKQVFNDVNPEYNKQVFNDLKAQFGKNVFNDITDDDLPF